MAVKNRKKFNRRAGGNPRTEKQILLARHKQGRKAAARKLGISPTHMVWVDDRLVFAADGELVRDALFAKGH